MKESIMLRLSEEEQEVLYFHIKKTGRNRNKLIHDIQETLTYYTLQTLDFFESDSVSEFTNGVYDSLLKKLKKETAPKIKYDFEFVKSTF